MLPAPLRKAGYALVAVYGLFAAVAPALASKVSVKLSQPGYSNTEALEAEDWYLRAVRAAGVGMLAAGGVGMLLEDRAATAGDEEGEDDPEEFEYDHESEDADDGPVEVDV
jgi:hypothetical protein